MKLSWTQPICDSCWLEREGKRVPYRVLHADTERCVFCGKKTDSGIYVREDPAKVPFPRAEEGEDVIDMGKVAELVAESGGNVKLSSETRLKIARDHIGGPVMYVPRDGDIEFAEYGVIVRVSANTVFVRFGRRGDTPQGCDPQDITFLYTEHIILQMAAPRDATIVQQGLLIEELEAEVAALRKGKSSFRTPAAPATLDTEGETHANQ